MINLGICFKSTGNGSIVVFTVHCVNTLYLFVIKQFTICKLNVTMVQYSFQKLFPRLLVINHDLLFEIPLVRRRA